jgi:hypothetical protein
MAIRLITYDPDESGRKNSALFEAVKGYGPWAKLSDAAYAVETNVSPERIMERLKEHVDPFDIVCVITLASPFCVVGHSDTDDWLSRKL